MHKAARDLAAANRENVAFMIGLTENAIGAGSFGHDDRAFEDIAHKHPLVSWALDHGLSAHDLAGFIREDQECRNLPGRYAGAVEDWAAKFDDPTIYADLRRVARDRTIAPLTHQDAYEQMEVVQDWYEIMRTTPGISDPRDIREVATILSSHTGKHIQDMQAPARALEKALREGVEALPESMRGHIRLDDIGNDVGDQLRRGDLKPDGIPAVVAEHLKRGLDQEMKRRTDFESTANRSKPRYRKASAPAI